MVCSLFHIFFVISLVVPVLNCFKYVYITPCWYTKHVFNSWFYPYRLVHVSLCIFLCCALGCFFCLSAFSRIRWRCNLIGYGLMDLIFLRDECWDRRLLQVLVAHKWRGLWPRPRVYCYSSLSCQTCLLRLVIIILEMDMSFMSFLSWLMVCNITCEGSLTYDERNLCLVEISQSVERQRCHDSHASVLVPRHAVEAVGW